MCLLILEKDASILQISSCKNEGRKKGLCRVQANKNTWDKWDGSVEWSWIVDFVSWAVGMVSLISWGVIFRLRSDVVHVHWYSVRQCTTREKYKGEESGSFERTGGYEDNVKVKDWKNVDGV